MKASIQKVLQSIEAFQAVATAYRRYGADNIGPQRQFEHLIARSFDMARVRAPRTARAWELYAGMEGVETAAEFLGEAAQDVVDSITELEISDLAESRYWLNFSLIFVSL